MHIPIFQGIVKRGAGAAVPGVVKSGIVNIASVLNPRVVHCGRF